MSLRTQLLLTATLSLVLSLILGASLAWWFAARSVDTELHAALTVSERVIGNAVQHMPSSTDPDLYLEHLVSTFDGNRHVRAGLIDGTGQTRVSSSVYKPARPAPSWYYNLVSVSADTRHVDIAHNGSSYQAVILETNPINEVSEVWTRSRDDLVIVAFFCGLILLMISVTVSIGLRPLNTLSAAIQTLGQGNYDVRVRSSGPPELAALADSFNHMASKLGDLEHKAQALNAQIQTIQEEERADLARDLHDDIGPFLFAVNVDTAAISELAKQSGHTEITNHARSIREAVSHMQSHVRAILERLRPAGLAEVGLRKAVENLAAFWKHRNGDMQVSIRIDPTTDQLEEHLEATVFRVIQESLSNAVRHGQVSTISISATLESAADEILVQIQDDGIGLAGPGLSTGFGLTGMRERVEALGGTVIITGNARRRGITVTARIPQEAPLPRLHPHRLTA